MPTRLSTGVDIAQYQMIQKTLMQLNLAVLTVCLSLTVNAADALSSVQSLEWGNDDASMTVDNEPSNDVSQEDVWLRIRSGFKIDDAASTNPLVAVHESWYAARPESILRMVNRSRRLSVSHRSGSRSARNADGNCPAADDRKCIQIHRAIDSCRIGHLAVHSLDRSPLRTQAGRLV